jgi:phosphoserine phosphatase
LSRLSTLRVAIENDNGDIGSSSKIFMQVGSAIDNRKNNKATANLKEYGFEVWILTASPEFLYQKFLAEELGLPDTQILGVKSVVANGRLTDEIIMPIPQDDGKANVIPTFIKARPLIVGGNSRGDMDMLNQS